MRLMRLARRAAFVLLAAAMLLIGLWCSVGIWYQWGAKEPWRSFLPGATTAFTLFTVASLSARRRWRVFAVYSAAVAVFLVWWATISPTNDRNWAPDVARSVTATIDGDRLVISNVRNFTW